MEKTVDILVVGCGPAGASAATCAASKGARVLCIDKKKEIGTPVRCGEGISSYFLNLFEFRIPDRCVNWRTKSTKFIFEEGSLVISSEEFSTIIVERKIFDKYLASLAISAGSRVLSNTELVDIEFDKNEKIKFATIKFKGREVKIKPKLIVAADGSFSKVGSLLEMYPKNISKDLFFGEEYELFGAKGLDSNNTQIFLGDFSPNGYAFIFPKSSTSCNFGVGTTNPAKGRCRSLDFLIEKENMINNQLTGASITECREGGIVVSENLKKPYYSSVMFVGDAARQNFGLFGEGIGPAILCGKIAGKYAMEYVTLSKKRVLEGYANDINLNFGNEFSRYQLAREICEKIRTEDIEKKYMLLALVYSEIVDPNLEKLEELSSLSNKKIKTRLKKQLYLKKGRLYLP